MLYRPAVLILALIALVSAMVEVGMRLSFLKYGTMGMVSLLADILHTTATSGAMIEEMQKAADRLDFELAAILRDQIKEISSMEASKRRSLGH